jgi:6-pyruvoyl-tetrahydropterin synthase
MTTATMFLNNVTSVDHAYVGSDGWVYGNSYSPMFTIGGKVDPEENVVVDFSTVKKAIKNLIDDRGAGLDHKLWFVKGFSNGTIEYTNNHKVTIDTPWFRYSGSKDSVKVIETPTHEVDQAFLAEVTSKEYLLPLLTELYKIDMTVECVSDPRPTIPVHSVPVHFNYTHGLKHSTSWGCQNMMHGHRSFLCAEQIENNPVKQYEIDLLLNTMAGFYHNKMFVWSENWFPTTQVLDYASRDRGEFYTQFKNDGAVFRKIEVLNTETTIEHIVSHIATRWEDDLRRCNIKSLYVSEGQNKGAVVSL